MSNATIIARIKSVEERLGKGGDRRAYSFCQLVLDAQRMREGMPSEEVAALRGPPEDTLSPGEKSFGQLVLESGFPEKWTAERRAAVEKLERERIESMRG